MGYKNDSQISIIVPAYNAAKYIEICTRSVINQTFHNWELILIDDGSIDATGAICDELAKQNQKIRVIHQKNGGEFESRRAGILKAQGDYVTFLDADDVFPQNYLKNICEYIDESTDIFFWGIKEFNEQGILRIDEVKTGIYTSRSFLEYTVETTGYSVCNKLFKRSLLDKVSQIKKPNVHYAEDSILLLNLIYQAKEIKGISGVYYMYRRHLNSVTYKFNVEKFRYLIEVTNYNIDLIQTEYENTDKLIKVIEIDFLKAISAYIYLAELNGVWRKEVYQYVYTSELYVRAKRNEKKEYYNIKEYFILKCFRWKLYWIIKLCLMPYKRLKMWK